MAAVDLDMKVARHRTHGFVRLFRFAHPREWRAPGPAGVAILAGVIALAVAVSASSQGEAAASRAQADAFIVQASAALRAGDLGTAAALSRSALQLAPTYSEALLVSAKVEAEDRDATAAALEQVQAAVRNASWGTTDPAVARQLLASLLTRTGRTVEGRREAERLRASRPDDPLNFLLVARALDKAGSLAAELGTLSDALSRFPEHDELRLQQAAVLARLGRNAEASALVRTGLRVHPDSLPLLLSSAGLEMDRVARRSQADLYLSRGGTDPKAAVVGMETAPVSQRRTYLDAFLSRSGLSHQDLVARVQDAVKGSRDLSSALASALAGYTGNRDVDADFDGYWDDRWTFDAGKLIHWTRDTAENGAPPYEASFRDGAPESFSVRAAGGSVTRFWYSRYPWLDRVDLPGDGTWFLVPYTVQCVFLRDGLVPADGTAPRIAPRLLTPSADTVRRGSSRQEQYGEDGKTLLRRIDIAHGLAVYMEESLGADGIMDHRVWFEGGRPVRGARSLARDGAYQVSETWKDGKLAAESVDTDGDGKVDYRETYGPAPVRSWDYNEDGKDDSREYLLRDGSHLRELSTRLDGVFDVRVVTRGARIESATRGGRALALTVDAARGVTWIGEPAHAQARPDPSAANQVQEFAGAPYLVFSMEGTLYAEALGQ